MAHKIVLSGIINSKLEKQNINNEIFTTFELLTQWETPNKTINTKHIILIPENIIGKSILSKFKENEHVCLEGIYVKDSETKLHAIKANIINLTMNKVFISGFIYNIDMKYTSTGKAIATINISAKNFPEKEPTWYKVEFWEKQAENISKYFREGQKVLIEGSIYYKEFNDRDNNKIRILTVNGSRIEFADKKENGESTNKSYEKTDSFLSNNTDIPF